MTRAYRWIALAGVLLALTLACAGAADGQSRGPSTPEERDRALRVAKDLRADPLAPGLKPDRQWLMRWLIEIPDISVGLCAGLMGDRGDAQKSDYSGALLAVMLAGQAAYVILNPKKAKDSKATYLAGVDAALDAYQAIRSKDAAFQAKKMEEFQQARNEGKLADAVNLAAKANKCK